MGSDRRAEMALRAALFNPKATQAEIRSSLQNANKGQNNNINSSGPTNRSPLHPQPYQKDVYPRNQMTYNPQIHNYANDTNYKGTLQTSTNSNYSTTQFTSPMLSNTATMEGSRGTHDASMSKVPLPPPPPQNSYTASTQLPYTPPYSNDSFDAYRPGGISLDGYSAASAASTNPNNQPLCASVPNNHFTDDNDSLVSEQKRMHSIDAAQQRQIHNDAPKLPLRRIQDQPQPQSQQQKPPLRLQPPPQNPQHQHMQNKPLLQLKPPPQHPYRQQPQQQQQQHNALPVGTQLPDVCSSAHQMYQNPIGIASPQQPQTPRSMSSRMQIRTEPVAYIPNGTPPPTAAIERSSSFTSQKSKTKRSFFSGFRRVAQAVKSISSSTLPHPPMTSPQQRQMVVPQNKGSEYRPDLHYMAHNPNPNSPSQYYKSLPSHTESDNTSMPERQPPPSVSSPIQGELPLYPEKQKAVSNPGSPNVCRPNMLIHSTSHIISPTEESSPITQEVCSSSTVDTVSKVNPEFSPVYEDSSITKLQQMQQGTNMVASIDHVISNDSDSRDIYVNSKLNSIDKRRSASVGGASRNRSSSSVTALIMRSQDNSFPKPIKKYFSLKGTRNHSNSSQHRISLASVSSFFPYAQQSVSSGSIKHSSSCSRASVSKTSPNTIAHNDNISLQLDTPSLHSPEPASNAPECPLSARSAVSQPTQGSKPMISPPHNNTGHSLSAKPSLGIITAASVSASQYYESDHGYSKRMRALTMPIIIPEKRNSRHSHNNPEKNNTLSTLEETKKYGNGEEALVEENEHPKAIWCDVIRASPPCMEDPKLPEEDSTIQVAGNTESSNSTGAETMRGEDGVEWNGKDDHDYGLEKLEIDITGSPLFDTVSKSDFVSISTDINMLSDKQISSIQKMQSPGVGVNLNETLISSLQNLKDGHGPAEYAVTNAPNASDASSPVLIDPQYYSVIMNHDKLKNYMKQVSDNEEAEAFNDLVKRLDGAEKSKSVTVAEIGTSSQDFDKNSRKDDPNGQLERKCEIATSSTKDSNEGNSESTVNRIIRASSAKSCPPPNNQRPRLSSPQPPMAPADMGQIPTPPLPPLHQQSNRPDSVSNMKALLFGHSRYSLINPDGSLNMADIRFDQLEGYRDNIASYSTTSLNSDSALSLASQPKNNNSGSGNGVGSRLRERGGRFWGSSDHRDRSFSSSTTLPMQNDNGSNSRFTDHQVQPQNMATQYAYTGTAHPRNSSNSGGIRLSRKLWRPNPVCSDNPAATGDSRNSMTAMQNSQTHPESAYSGNGVATPYSQQYQTDQTTFSSGAARASTSSTRGQVSIQNRQSLQNTPQNLATYKLQHTVSTSTISSDISSGGVSQASGAGNLARPRSTNRKHSSDILGKQILDQVRKYNNNSFTSELKGGVKRRILNQSGSVSRRNLKYSVYDEIFSQTPASMSLSQILKAEDSVQSFHQPQKHTHLHRKDHRRSASGFTQSELDEIMEQLNVNRYILSRALQTQKSAHTGLDSWIATMIKGSNNEVVSSVTTATNSRDGMLLRDNGSSDCMSSFSAGSDGLPSLAEVVECVHEGEQGSVSQSVLSLLPSSHLRQAAPALELDQEVVSALNDPVSHPHDDVAFSPLSVSSIEYRTSALSDKGSSFELWSIKSDTQKEDGVVPGFINKSDNSISDSNMSLTLNQTPKSVKALQSGSNVTMSSISETNDRLSNSNGPGRYSRTRRLNSNTAIESSTSECNTQFGSSGLLYGLEHEEYDM